jgi:hypothetical protein
VSPHASAIFLLYAPGQILFTLFAIGDMDGVAIYRQRRFVQRL